MLARIGLAAVFIVAGLAKLVDQPGSRRALRDFDVPEPFVAPLVYLLPAAELATAAALLFSLTARWGGAAAVALLLVFVLGLTRSLRRGSAPDCHCFGQVHSEPASWQTVGRNVVLALPAAYVASAGGPSLSAWATGHSAEGLWLIATSSVATLGILSSLALWRQNRTLRSIQPWAPPVPLSVGVRAPQFALVSAAGRLVALRDLLADARPCMVTFVAPSCGPCTDLLPEIVRWRETFADRLVLPVVSGGDADAAGKLADEFGLIDLLVDPGSTVSRAYAVPGTPCAVLVAPDGTVRSAPAAGQVAIEALVRFALQNEAPALVADQVA